MPRSLEALDLNLEERRDGILRHFKNLLRMKVDLNHAIEELFEDYSYLEKVGHDGRSLAQKAREEVEKEKEQKGFSIRLVK